MSFLEVDVRAGDSIGDGDLQTLVRDSTRAINARTRDSKPIQSKSSRSGSRGRRAWPAGRESVRQLREWWAGAQRPPRAQGGKPARSAIRPLRRRAASRK